MTVKRRNEDDFGKSRTVIREPESSYWWRDTETLGEEVVVESRADPRVLARRWVRTLALWLALAGAIVETLLAFRLILRLVAANPGNGFVDFIYDVSGPLVEPFEGIARNRFVDGGVFEPATATAMAVYLVAALLLIGVLWAVTAAPAAGERSAVTRSQRRTHALRED